MQIAVDVIFGLAWAVGALCLMTGSTKHNNARKFYGSKKRGSQMMGAGLLMWFGGSLVKIGAIPSIDAPDGLIAMTIVGAILLTAGIVFAIYTLSQIGKEWGD